MKLTNIKSFASNKYYGQIVGQTWFFTLGVATSLGEGKL